NQIYAPWTRPRTKDLPLSSHFRMQPLSHLSYWKQLVFKRREDEAIVLTRMRFEAKRLTSDEAISDQRTYKVSCN
ncbi:hypothetical protein Tco_1178037, partial [Tanacetum coccineum]